MKHALRPRDGHVGVADELDQPSDPGGGEEGDVDGRRESEGDVAQRGEPGGEALQRAPPADLISDDGHAQGKRGEILPARGDDDDRGRGLADEPDDPTE